LNGAFDEELDYDEEIVEEEEDVEDMEAEEGGEPMEEVDEAGEMEAQKKKLTRCTFWPMCDKGKYGGGAELGNQLNLE